MIYTNSKGQIVAESQNGRLYKRVLRSKHYMKMFQGYGLDKSIFDEASKEVHEIWLLEKDTKKVYKSKVYDWVEHGIIKNFDGEQIFLPLSKWSLTNVDESQLKLI